VTASLKDQLLAPMVALRALNSTLEHGELSHQLDQRIRQHSRVLARSVALLIEDLVLVRTAAAHRPAVLAPEKLVLGEQVRRAVAIFPEQAIHVSAMPDIHVTADQLRLQQLLVNLIRGSRAGRPLRFDAGAGNRHVVLRLTGSRPRDCHQLDIARLLAHAHGGQLYAQYKRGSSVQVVLPLASSPWGE
jgi:signal transduction histidine kinase